MPDNDSRGREFAPIQTNIMPLVSERYNTRNMVANSFVKQITSEEPGSSRSNNSKRCDHETREQLDRIKGIIVDRR